MKCPSCGAEPGPNELLVAPCPACGHLWYDTYQYVYTLAEEVQPVRTVLDIGCGQKGIIGQYYWDHVRPIQQGYMCDIHTLKPAPAHYQHLLMDAEDLLDLLGPQSVDFVTHCGFLEHLDYEKALRVLWVIEQVAKKRVFGTASAVLREVDWKARQDGNPYHIYQSWWDAGAFEALGYHVDRERMRTGKTFREEVVFWFDPSELRKPWIKRVEDARAHICYRRCHVFQCVCEPAAWDPVTNCWTCVKHTKNKGLEHPGSNLELWLVRSDFEETFPTPPWRDKRPCK